VTTVPVEDMARLLTVLRDEYGGSVDALLTAAQKGAAAGGRRRRQPDPVTVRTAGEVMEAVRLKLVTREEARRLLGLRASMRTATRSRPTPVRSGSEPTELFGWGREPA
jgi:hypothetical protein